MKAIAAIVAVASITQGQAAITAVTRISFAVAP